MKKKALSLLLAGAMTVSMGISAMATQVTAPSGTASTELEGTIKATQLVVTVPANVQFQIDPTKERGDSEEPTPTGQVKQPEVFQIKNSSVVPVYVSINNMTAQDVTLVNTLDQLRETEKSMMFALSSKDVARDFNQETDWLITGKDYSEDHYALDGSNGKIDAVQSGNVASVMDLEISARTELGWSDGETFTIMPTFIVTVQEPKPENGSPSDSTEPSTPEAEEPSGE